MGYAWTCLHLDPDLAAEREALIEYEIDQAERIREDNFQLDLRRDVTCWERIIHSQGNEPPWACLEWGLDGHNFPDCKECQNRLYQFIRSDGLQESDDLENGDELESDALDSEYSFDSHDT